MKVHRKHGENMADFRERTDRIHDEALVRRVEMQRVWDGFNRQVHALAFELRRLKLHEQ